MYINIGLTRERSALANRAHRLNQQHCPRQQSPRSPMERLAKPDLQGARGPACLGTNTWRDGRPRRVFLCPRIPGQAVSACTMRYRRLVLGSAG